MREGLRVRDLANDEGGRLLRIVRRCSGSVVTWRRAQMVLLSAQGMDIAQIADYVTACWLASCEILASPRTCPWSGASKTMRSMSRTPDRGAKESVSLDAN